MVVSLSLMPPSEKPDQGEPGIPGPSSFKKKGPNPLFSTRHNPATSTTMQSRVGQKLQAERFGVRGLVTEKRQTQHAEPPTKFDTDRLRKAFDACDFDLSGVLTKDKIRHVLALLGEVVDEAILETMLGDDMADYVEPQVLFQEMADCDGDGRITWDDFATLFRNPAKAFQRADARDDRVRLESKDLERQQLERRKQQQELILTIQEGKMAHTEEIGLLDIFTRLTGSTSIQPSDLKHMYKLFKEIDTEKSGELGLDKFTRMFPGQDAALIERMFDLFDTDGSGIIELRKFIIGLSNVSSISTVEKVKLAFSLYDLDNSGSLEYAEVLQLLTAAHAGTGPISDSDVRTRAHEVYANLGIAPEGSASGEEDIYPCLSYEQFVNIADERPQLLLPVHVLAHNALAKTPHC